MNDVNGYSIRIWKTDTLDFGEGIKWIIAIRISGMRWMSW